GQKFDVVVGPSDADISVSAAPAAAAGNAAQPVQAPASGGGSSIEAPLSGNIFKVNVKVGQTIAENDVVVILEAMKMETEVRSVVAGTVQSIQVSEGDAVNVGQPILTIA
ncbi:MAG: biotin/lipoyl-containing protein, partial [Arenicella sp.]